MSDTATKKKRSKSQDVIQVSNMTDEHSADPSKSTPTELLMKFLTSIMTKDYEQALIYCTKILSHEPKNETALEFYPLILEKLEIMKSEEGSTESSSTSSTSSDSSENIFFNDESLFKVSAQNSSGSNSTQDDVMPDLNKKSSNMQPMGKEIVNENKSKLFSHSKPKNNVKTFSKKELKMRTENEEPSSLLIHPTQTITIIGNRAPIMEEEVLSNQQQRKQTPTDSTDQCSSNALLRTSRTFTFPKSFPNRNSEMTGKPK